MRALVAAFVLLFAGVASAEPLPRAYVDEVAVFGDIDAGAARDAVARTLQRAGYAVELATAEQPPCGPDLACLLARAGECNAALALRVTVLGTGGAISARFSGATVGAGVLYHHEGPFALEGADAASALALAGWAPPPRDRGGRVLPWTLAIGGAAVAIAGGLSLWRGHAIERDFFDDHVNAAGEVFGISPDQAAATETRARRWQWAGAALLAVGTGAGVTGSILLFRHRGDEAPRPAGLALRGRF